MGKDNEPHYRASSSVLLSRSVRDDRADFAGVTSEAFFGSASEKNQCPS
jgi:hypothetical protein